MNCLGEVVHNKSVNNKLIKEGVIFIDKPEEATLTTVIRAHGIPKDNYDKMNNKKIIDLTYPKL